MDKTYRMVVGVDGSAGGRLALTWAVQEAARRGGSVQAVTAWHWDGPRSTPIVDVTPEDAKNHAKAALARELEAVATHVPSAPPIASELVQGSPATVLTRAATDADLLVLGSHGHGRLHHAVLGSVSEECIRHAPCPVVVVAVPVKTESAPTPATVG